jgi:hypothetical protein
MKSLKPWAIGWVIFSVIITVGALLGGPSDRPEDAAMPLNEAPRFFLFMLLGVPLIMGVSIPLLFLMGALNGGGNKEEETRRQARIIAEELEKRNR